MTSLALYRKLFVGRADVYAVQQSDGSYFPVDEDLSDVELKEHLAGIASYGTYVVTPGANTVSYIVFDLDTLELTALDHLLKCVTEFVGDDYLESLLVEGNAWAKNAGVLMISFASKNFARNNKPNYHYLHDTGAASAYLVAQLPSLGLVGHQMQGFDKDSANEKLGVPDDYAPGSMIAVGYYAGQEGLKDEWKQREDAPRVRKDLHDIAFNGAWKAER